MTYPKTWTGKLVKKHLPRVDVKLFGKVHRGFVSGRRNRYASVWFEQSKHVYETQYSWPAVARALNAGKALRIS